MFTVPSFHSNTLSRHPACCSAISLLFVFSRSKCLCVWHLRDFAQITKKEKLTHTICTPLLTSPQLPLVLMAKSTLQGRAGRFQFQNCLALSFSFIICFRPSVYNSRSFGGLFCSPCMSAENTVVLQTALEAPGAHFLLLS